MTREQKRRADRTGRWCLAGLLISATVHLWALAALLDALADAAW